MHHPFVLLVVPQDHLLPEQYVVTMRDNLLDRCPVSSFEEVSGVWSTWGLSSAYVLGGCLVSSSGGERSWGERGSELHVGVGKMSKVRLCKEVAERMPHTWAARLPAPARPHSQAPTAPLLPGGGLWEVAGGQGGGGGG